MAGWNVEYTDQDFIPVADNLYDEHLEELRQQGETT
jgi:hypothetical protein